MRAWREEAAFTQDDVATAARGFGLNWTRDTVAAIENGRREITLSEFTVLRGRGIERSELERLFNPKAPERSLPLKVAAQQDAERKAAQKLGVSPERIVKASERLWGRTLTAERDRLLRENVGMDQAARDFWKRRGQRVAPRDLRTLQATRGHITRALVEKLREALTRKAAHR